jgi:hypothetical protein
MIVKKALLIISLCTAFVACKPYHSTIKVQGTTENCTGRDLGTNTLEEVAFIKKEYVYRKANSKKPFIPVKTDENGYIHLQHKAKRLEFFRVEKVSDKIETNLENCKKWQKTPDFTIEANRKTTEREVFYHQDCNPCLLPMP